MLKYAGIATGTSSFREDTPNYLSYMEAIAILPHVESLLMQCKTAWGVLAGPTKTLANVSGLYYSLYGRSLVLIKQKVLRSLLKEEIRRPRLLAPCQEVGIGQVFWSLTIG